MGRDSEWVEGEGVRVNGWWGHGMNGSYAYEMSNPERILRAVRVRAFSLYIFEFAQALVVSTATF